MRNTTALAISAGCPILRTGSFAAAPSNIAFRFSSESPLQIGVSMMPGETAFTRTGASSSASPRESASSAALIAP